VGQDEAFFARYFFRNWLSGLSLGLITTALVQSSSVTTSLVVPLAAAGVLRLRQIFPYTVGANIGTTVTAIIAGAASGTSPGLAIAFAHFLFNVTGACLFLPLRFIPISLAAWYARLAATKRGLALIYILVLFFLLPLVCIMLAK
jgi:sodium-dependent phosphate cotransporter